MKSQSGIEVPLRLRFLAEFDAKSLQQHAAIVFGPDPPMSQRMMLAEYAETEHVEVAAERQSFWNKIKDAVTGG